MPFKSRLILLFALLAVGLAGQWALNTLVAGDGPLEPVALQRPLAELPLELGDWLGRDRPIENERLLYADEHLQRDYVNPKRNQALTLWIAYSRNGADRGHHPEVCFQVAGQPEDESGRQTCQVAGHEAPVQQYRFGRPGNRQLVYYWYYTLNNPEMAGLSPLQKIYQLCRQRPASMTIEVFAPENSEGDMKQAQDFVRRVDEQLQKQLGPAAIRGSRRIPVTVIAQGA